jgi:hypothetical protein
LKASEERVAVIWTLKEPLEKFMWFFVLIYVFVGGLVLMMSQDCNWNTTTFGHRIYTVE